MKLLAFTDLHGSLLALRRIEQAVRTQKPDLLVCAGDVFIFEQGFISVMRKLNILDKKIVIIHGNHEEPSIFKKCARLFKNIIFIHKKEFIINNVVFLGYEAANRLFGNSPSVGETIRIGGGTSSFSFCSKRWRPRSSVACLE